MQLLLFQVSAIDAKAYQTALKEAADGADLDAQLLDKLVLRVNKEVYLACSHGQL